jgi:hypothetical protein
MKFKFLTAINFFLILGFERRVDVFVDADVSEIYGPVFTPVSPEKGHSFSQSTPYPGPSLEPN